MPKKAVHTPGPPFARLSTYAIGTVLQQPLQWYPVPLGNHQRLPTWYIASLCYKDHQIGLRMDWQDPDVDEEEALLVAAD